MSLVVLWIPPCGFLQCTPALRWSFMNSPYCCLMEIGTQTNAQPLPGSAPRVLINPDAETLMALIFQTKRCLRLTALPQQEWVSIRDTAQRQRGLSVHVTPGPFTPSLLEISPYSAHLCLQESTKWCRRDKSLCFGKSANYIWNKM